MERPEAMDSGSIILTGFDKNNVMASIRAMIKQNKNNEEKSIPNDYLITNTSSRVLNLILGTTKISNLWDGIK